MLKKTLFAAGLALSLLAPSPAPAGDRCITHQELLPTFKNNGFQSPEILVELKGKEATDLLETIGFSDGEAYDAVVVVDVDEDLSAFALFKGDESCGVIPLPRIMAHTLVGQPL